MEFFKKEEKNTLKEENALLKMKVQELQATIQELNKTIEAYKAKEESISSAIVFAVERSNQLEASRKKLYQLDIQRSRLLYMRMEQVLAELFARHPELKKDSRLSDTSEKFRQAVYSQSDLNNTENSIPTANTKEDPIRKLLNNIINYIDDEKQGVKSIPRADRAPIKQSNLNYMEANYAKPIPNTSSSGFDFNEALHPSESLEEILKAFDLGKNKSKNS